MALPDGGLTLLTKAISTAIAQINATRAAAGKLPLTDSQIYTALATSFAALLPTA